MPESTYHFHDLLHPFKLLSHRKRFWQFHLSGQCEVLSHRQLLVVGSCQLKDVASVGHIPVTNLLNWDTIDVDLTLCGAEGDLEGGRKRERERERDCACKILIIVQAH